MVPAVSPVTRYVAVICPEAFAVALVKLTDFVSSTATADVPETTKPM